MNGLQAINNNDHSAAEISRAGLSNAQVLHRNPFVCYHELREFYSIHCKHEFFYCAAGRCDGCRSLIPDSIKSMIEFCIMISHKRRTVAKFNLSLLRCRGAKNLRQLLTSQFVYIHIFVHYKFCSQFLDECKNRLVVVIVDSEQTEYKGIS
jgi:hypothetical protein